MPASLRQGVADASRQLGRLTRTQKVGVAVAVDGLLAEAAILLSLVLLDPTLPGRFLGAVPWLAPAFVAGSCWIFLSLGLYRAVVRYMGSQTLALVAAGGAVSSAYLGLLVTLSGKLALPIGAYFIYPLLLWVLMVVVRLALRSFLFVANTVTASSPLLIYGAGRAGLAVLDVLGGQGFRPVAFIDDDRSKHKTVIRGVPVYQSDRLEKLIERDEIRDVLLAMPKAPRSRRRAIIERLEPLRVRVRSVPSLEAILRGTDPLGAIRKVGIDDVLGRDPIAPDEALLRQGLAGQGVLVTGAAGSIGSELARQILQARPARLVLLEQSEFGLYDLERRLAPEAARLGVPLIPVLASVLDGAALKRAFSVHEIAVVYHAAAYKHVPLVESNEAAGLRTNVFGTLTALEAAEAAGVKAFTLISTDKAVNPTNVMGASKRVAELVVQAKAQNSTVRCAMVRFGNVLGSSGSVVPLFQSQIEAGGPVTVTHPEVVRYFMTIPEAAQLVLQASAMARGGDVFLLDMGEPVKILDLARRFIRLAGLSVRDAEHPDGDIDIVFSGLRPGEKLFEELLISGAEQGTAHPRIFTAEEPHLPWAALAPHLEALRGLCEAGDGAGLRAQLRTLVEGYQPSDAAPPSEQPKAP